ncbi:hypothetical protein ACP70R_020408 [Stipagrostis hirtigluma subsp. patula]
MDDGDDSYAGDRMAAEPPRAEAMAPQPASPTTVEYLSHLLRSLPSITSVAPRRRSMARFEYGRFDVGSPWYSDGDIGLDSAFWDGGGLRSVPASGEAIAALPATTAGEGETGEKGVCAVCLEGYEAGDALRTMPCAHGFHEGCIFEWLRVSRLCPLCRFAMPANTETELDKEGEDGNDGDEEEHCPSASSSSNVHGDSVGQG